jgi:hypothetical protein
MLRIFQRRRLKLAVRRLDQLRRVELVPPRGAAVLRQRAERCDCGRRVAGRRVRRRADDLVAEQRAGAGGRVGVEPGSVDQRGAERVVGPRMPRVVSLLTLLHEPLGGRVEAAHFGAAACERNGTLATAVSARATANHRTEWTLGTVLISSPASR